ncbi:Uncharacterized protein dnm_063670 [Desulfonema magnum]|uniref:Uncharacterized protein n=1 Tax=Desulfonema magnum TaxID=45655 RepID=A0A975BRI2_9BACT|nr:Uncharacterized protein dnm_063670 [Desulfonema magnum]
MLSVNIFVTGGKKPGFFMSVYFGQLRQADDKVLSSSIDKIKKMLFTLDDQIF